MRWSPHETLWLHAAWALGILAASLGLGYVFRRAVAQILDRWFQKTETQLDDILWGACRSYIPFWFFLIGCVIAARVAPIPASLYRHIDHTVMALFVITLSLSFASLLSRLLRTYAPDLGLQTPSTSLMENLLRIVILTLGVLLFLSNLGISITPLLTALGVGSLAVALALQDTLSNLFAGFYMLVNRQIEVGDWIKLDSGQEGRVHDIGLRSTGVRDSGNNIVLIPNSKLAQAMVTNYSLEEKELALPIQAGVSYGCDLDQVERVALEVATSVQIEIPGAVPGFTPLLFFHTLAESSVNFVVVLRVQEFTAQGPVRHAFIKRLHTRFRKEGIEIPFPQRVVHVKGTVPA